VPGEERRLVWTWRRSGRFGEELSNRDSSVVQSTSPGPLVLIKHVCLSTEFRLLMLQIKADLFIFLRVNCVCMS
jgi:hypothetical protein